jgi:hypothetical protein
LNTWPVQTIVLQHLYLQRYAMAQTAKKHSTALLDALILFG